MDDWPFVPVARVVKARGLDGEVAVASIGDLVASIPAGTLLWFVPPPDSPRAYRLSGVRPGPKGPIVKLAGVDDPATARALVGTTALAARDALPEDVLLPPPSLAGLRVFDEEHGDLGSVVDVIVTGANDVLVVEGAYGEVLIPVIDDVVLDIDREAGAARVRLLPGLLPGEAEEV